MKAILLLFVVCVFILNQAQSQKIDSINKVISKLEMKLSSTKDSTGIYKLKDSIKTLENKIEEIKNNIILQFSSKNDTLNFSTFTVKAFSFISKNPEYDPKSKSVPKGTKLILKSFVPAIQKGVSSYWLLSTREYIDDDDVFQTNEMIRYKSQIESNLKKNKNELILSVTKTYGKINADNLKLALESSDLSFKYWIGMPDDLATITLGKPDYINRSVYSFGVHEQWVYEKYDLYLYFENSILKSYQDKK